MAKTKKNGWFRDYGDGYETDDTVLWVDGEPTENIVSPISSQCFYGYYEGTEIGVFPTRSEAKEEIERLINENKKSR